MPVVEALPPMEEAVSHGPLAAWVPLPRNPRWLFALGAAPTSSLAGAIAVPSPDMSVGWGGPRGRGVACQRNGGLRAYETAAPSLAGASSAEELPPAAWMGGTPLLAAVLVHAGAMQEGPAAVPAVNDPMATLAEDQAEGADDANNARPRRRRRRRKKAAFQLIRLCSRVGPLQHNTEDSCSVCLEAMEAGQQVRTLPCFHMLHVKCSDMYFRAKDIAPICPVCRAHVCAGAVDLD